MSLAPAQTGASFVPPPGTVSVTENCGTVSSECRPCLFADHCATFIPWHIADMNNYLLHMSVSEMSDIPYKPGTREAEAEGHSKFKSALTT